MSIQGLYLESPPSSCVPPHTFFSTIKANKTTNPYTKPPKMLTETLPQNQSFFLNHKPHHSIPPKTPSFLTLPHSPHLPFSKALKPPKLRTKATISDEFVLPQAHSNSTFYELLGISTHVGVIEIKQAYKQLARKYHPDVSPPDRTEEYTQKFILVQEAYETLSDPNRRALYDRDMSRGLHLAFSARRSYDDQGLMQRNEWRNQWESQVEGLKNKRMTNNNMSWAAQMRRKRAESDGVD